MSVDKQYDLYIRIANFSHDLTLVLQMQRMLHDLYTEDELKVYTEKASAALDLVAEKLEDYHAEAWDLIAELSEGDAENSS